MKIFDHFLENVKLQLASGEPISNQIQTNIEPVRDTIGLM